MFAEVKKHVEEHGVTLVAVTKTRSVEEIMVLYEAGLRDMGENRVQELIAKQEALPKDIRWHLIGHLQSNKVKYIAPFIFLIHSVDSLDLYKTIEEKAKKENRKIDILLQFHVAQEESKFGLSWEEAEKIILYHFSKEKTRVRIRGVMGMASFTDDETQVRKEFRIMHEYFQRLKARYFTYDEDFQEISMGMSQDYKIAIEEGSTMVRVGSLLFE